ncbi:hypothetical protein E6H33_10505 [Candidatus Bathyarchaeota archaeon]|nr:MAG: hypothetical protein E6H33_10505 [Candidatus Bathyarchaeota archaeon]
MPRDRPSTRQRRVCSLHIESGGSVRGCPKPDTYSEHKHDHQRDHYDFAEPRPTRPQYRQGSYREKPDQGSEEQEGAVPEV